ncbi:MAG: helix-turn-helix domain-containing protein [Actinomycetota bacterium]|nr:helix-turn-helix domain-containing protein [Actinomycetota bacterium]
MIGDPDLCYEATRAKDPRFDGWFVLAVTTTGVYCRPSCPARTPRRENARFYPCSAAAQAAGFRACRRCRPDATPGSPEWSTRSDVVARAMRLVRDGVVEREGVGGLARRLGYSERQLNRLVTAELGAGPLAIARAERSQTARALLEGTDLPVAEVAFASGFASVRQFNETLRQVFGDTPTGLRRSRTPREERAVRPGASPSLRLRLAARAPFAAGPLFAFLGARAVPGVEELVGATYRRSLRLARGPAIVALTPDATGHGGRPSVEVVLALSDVRDLAAAVARCRRLLDLDADPVAVDAALSADPLLGPSARAVPGRRVPGSVDGFELAARALLGEHDAPSGARDDLRRLVEAAGEPLPFPSGSVCSLFPSPGALLSRGAGRHGISGPRRTALLALARAADSGDLLLDAGSDPAEARAALAALPGSPGHTAEHVAMRALRDPDAFPSGDPLVESALATLGARRGPEAEARPWRPWRSYATAHLWALAERRTA